MQLYWNFRLCCFYFFPNSALRNRGCGLSMHAACTRTFTVLLEVRICEFVTNSDVNKSICQHYVLLAGRRTLLQNECFWKNFPLWEINWKGYYRNHSTVAILSNWFPTVESSSVSIHFEAKFFFRRKEHYVTWLIWALQMVMWASPKFKCNRLFFSGC